MDSEKTIKQLKTLTNVSYDSLSKKKKDDLIEIVLLLKRALTNYSNKTLSAREAAKLFNRKKTWIYDALSRPRTDLQHKVAGVATRKEGSISFRSSDLIQIREEMLNEKQRQREEL